MAVVKDFMNYLVQKERKTPWTSTRLRMLRKRNRCQSLDDRLPRGFLAGAIVEVWVALRLNWACELPLNQGEELP